jgi:ubiquinone/menaquinone biosynthesis C-methylase UbiE
MNAIQTTSRKSYGKYKMEYNANIKRTIYYVPSKYDNENSISLDIVDVFNDKHIGNNYTKCKFLYKFILKIINHHLWEYPDAIKNLVACINIMILTEVDYTEKIIFTNIRQKYLEIKDKYNIANKLTEEGGIQRGLNRVKSISKNILRFKPHFRPANYLDIGCFDGNITFAIGNYFNLQKSQINGVDIVEFNNRNKNITFAKYDGITLPYDDNSFDLITCLMTLHHIQNENLSKIMCEIYRVLKKNGIVIVREHNTNKHIEYTALDIMHKFYDYVWSPTDKWSDSFENGNYKSHNQWTDLFINNGFEVDVMPDNKYFQQMYKTDTNPFMTYLCSYKKISIMNLDNSATEDTQTASRTLCRILQDDSPREKYHKITSEVNTSPYWGQRKLILGEIEFLTMFLENYSDSKNIYVIYAGASPGTHVLYLSQMFPKIYFELYDPREFKIKLNNVHEKTRIQTHVQYFTDETASYWKSDDHLDKVILFISDIRTGTTQTMPIKEVEERVRIDQEWQQTWYNIIKPQMAMLKFRLPWDDSQTEYLNGDIYIQPYPPITSTETRLIIKEAGTKIYDNKKYEEQLFYFNRYSRHHVYSNILEDINEKDKNGLKNTYDYASEIYILEQYLNLIKFHGDKKQKIINMVGDISNSLSPTRTLFKPQPLREYKQKQMSNLQKNGQIPNNIKFNQDTYNKFVVPRYDWFVEHRYMSE